MSWSAALALALRALWRNKTRAMLTTLGVIIGVASVIAMVAIGTGAQQHRPAARKHGDRSGTVTRGGVRTGAGTTTSLTLADAEAIAELPDAVAVAPSVQTPAQVRYRPDPSALATKHPAAEPV